MSLSQDEKIKYINKTYQQMIESHLIASKICFVSDKDFIPIKKPWYKKLLNKIASFVTRYKIKIIDTHKQCQYCGDDDW